MKNKRLYGMDLIKTVAIFFVISVHFFLNSGYYYTVMSGKTMLIMTFFRWLFFSCVPLFLISTGFLRSKKEATKSYYFSLVPVYISYLIAAIAAVFVKNTFSDGLPSGLFFDVLSILSFKNGYAWYMEMFFGLAVLIPFVNLAYNNIKEKKHKLMLIAALLFLTGVCSLDLKLTRNGNTYYLLSDYWVILYPFTYYLIGAYIKEYKPKINKIFGSSALIFIILFETVYTYIRCKNQFFNWALLGGYGGITVAVSSVILFPTLYSFINQFPVYYTKYPYCTYF